MSGHKDLFYNQLNNWQMASDNYQRLAGILTKDFYSDNQLIRVQYNPGRIASSTANVSSQFVKERPCFLCEKNRPAQQEGIEITTVNLKNKYTILVNPFPVFPIHFTISGNHEVQHLNNNFRDLLEISEKLNDCVIFYNGPKCGASAPDHMHFQAGNKGGLPFINNIESIIENSFQFCFGQNASIFEFCVNKRTGWIIKSNNIDEHVLAYNSIYNNLKSFIDDIEEPMMNVLCYFENNSPITVIFPRAKHRPDRYYSENDDKLLISPASVEMGGLIICSNKDDFDKVCLDDILEIYSEIVLCQSNIRTVSLKTNDILKNDI